MSQAPKQVTTTGPEKKRLVLEPKEPSLPDSEDDSGSLASLEEPSLAEKAQMAHDVLSSIFAFKTEDTILNVADCMLLIRDSIDKNSRCILRLHQELADLKLQQIEFQEQQLHHLEQMRSGTAKRS